MFRALLLICCLDIVDEDLIFKLEDYHNQETVQAPISKSNQSSQKYRSNRSPSKYRPQSVKQRHVIYLNI